MWEACAERYNVLRFEPGWRRTRRCGWIFLPLAGQEIGEADLPARPENIMLGDEPADLVLHRLRQGIVGGAHISEFGLATAERTGWRHRDGISIPSTTGTDM